MTTIKKSGSARKITALQTSIRILRRMQKMMQKTDDDVFVACCDECFDEIGFRGRWNDFQGFIKSEGWHIRRSKNRGEMVEHICPACWKERTANDQNTHSR